MRPTIDHATLAMLMQRHEAANHHQSAVKPQEGITLRIALASLPLLVLSGGVAAMALLTLH